MTAVTFDTLKFVETLKASGFDDTQAKGMAQAIQEVQNAHIDGLATKRELDARLAEMEVRLIKWMVGTSGAVVAVLKFLPGGH